MNNEQPSTKIAIGIDLGTTNTLISVWRDGKAEIIENIPSCVAFGGNGYYVGESAADFAIETSSNIIYDNKRVIGQNFTTAKNRLNYLPVAVVNDGKNRPQFDVQLENEPSQFYPVEISALVLKTVKEHAESVLKQCISHCVITVPAYFDDSQRQSTHIAASLAGLTVQKMISEPVAAALAFGIGEKIDRERNILVYDLGGGTFDVAIISVSTIGMYDVRATNGDTRLGGSNFDMVIIDHCVNHLKNDALDIGCDDPFLRRACITAKIELSDMSSTKVIVDWIGNDTESYHYVPISRDQFDSMIGDYIQQTMQCVQYALQDANMDKNEIDDILLVGGSSKIPLVGSTLKEFFGKPSNNSVNPLEAVAMGAAVQSATLLKLSDAPVILLKPVIPLSLGVLLQDKTVRRIIKRNTPYPTRVSRKITTVKDKQSYIKMDIFEGESKDPRRCKHLGQLQLHEIELGSAGVVKGNMTFTIKRDGNLMVDAVDFKTKSTASIEIIRPNSFDGDEIAAMKTRLEKLNVQTCQNLCQNIEKRKMFKAGGFFSDLASARACDEPSVFDNSSNREEEENTLSNVLEPEI